MGRFWGVRGTSEEEDERDSARIRRRACKRTPALGLENNIMTQKQGKGRQQGNRQRARRSKIWRALGEDWIHASKRHDTHDTAKA